MMPDRGAEPGTLKMYIPQMVSEGGLFFATPYPTDAGLSVARCLRSASGSDACVAVVEAGSKLAFLNSTDGLKYYREAATGNIFLRIINPASICFEYEQVYILKNMPESDLDWYYYAITSNKTSREDVTMSLPDADWAYDSRITYEYNQYAGGKHASQRPDNAAWEVWGASAQGPVPTSVCDSSASSDAVVSVAASSEAVVSVAAMSSESVLALVIITCVFAVLVGSYVLVGVCSRRSNVAKRAIEASASAGAGGNKTEASAAPCAVAGEPPKTTSELRTADAHGPLVLGKEPPSHITTTEEAPMCGCSG